MNNYYTKNITTIGTPIKNLFAKEYEDPRDATYLKALKLNKDFDHIIKIAIEYSFEHSATIQYTGSHIKVTKKNMPYLFNCVETACKILGVNDIPNTYIQQHPLLNANTIGSNHPMLVINDSLLKRLNHEELMFVIGHEIGHIKSEHCQYFMIGQYIEQALIFGTNKIPVIGPLISTLVETGLGIAYFDWSRKAEFTADHAGLLVSQDLKAAISAQAKLSGYPEEFYDTLDINEFLEQAQEFEDFENNSYDKLLKLLLTIDKSHPWSVQRAKELMLWVQNGNYSKIINRCSDWLYEELNRLENVTNSAKDKHIKKNEILTQAIKNSQEELDNLSNEDVQGVKAILELGKKGVKNIQNKVNDEMTKKKQENADAAFDTFLEACKQEKEIRNTINETTTETLNQHIKETIGDLKMIDAPIETVIDEVKEEIFI